MTALDSYERLEATGLWRATADAQRREVVVSVGEATLTISDMSETVLAHWSLAAVVRSNPGKRPAMYHPDGGPEEQLELGANETAMEEAITQIQRAVARRKARPGRLRWGVMAVLLGGLMLGSVLWLPQALRGYALRVVPESQRAELGEALLSRLERAAGAACETPESPAILARLAARVGARALVVLPGGGVPALHLPGGTVVLHREVLEDHDDPAVPAGFALVETVRAAQLDPLEAALLDGGLRATLLLLTTGRLPAALLDGHAEAVLTRVPSPVPEDAALRGFAEAGLPATPYALAVDVTGMSTRGLIDGDPIRPGDAFVPALSDGDWLRLQTICGG